MLKQLRSYYVYVALPYILLLVGAAYYFNAIKMTILRNPHPQINYAIFVIIIVGGLLIIRNVRRLMKEAQALSEFTTALRSGADLATLQEMALNFMVDIAYVLRMIAASGGRPISHQEQTAIEHELSKAAGRLARRNALPQFLTSLLVGMGLLGTFIGLLATLNDISALISSFADMDMATANPIVVFRNMIERMKAPMQSMGIAFSASLFGLLGSIILGLMMVALKRFQSDILSVLGSEVAQHIEFALAHDGFAYSKGALKMGLNQLRTEPLSARDVLARPVSPLDPRLSLSNVSHDAPQEQDGVVGGMGGEPGVAMASAVDERQPPVLGVMQAVVAERSAGGAVQPDDQLAGGGVASEGGMSPTLYAGEEAKILLRIEERMAESARMQQRALSAEIDDFHKQRADMLRTLTEQTESSNNFRSELQRVGRQLGTILGIMEKGNAEVMSQLSELTVRIAGDFTESHRIMIIQAEEQRKLNEQLKQTMDAFMTVMTNQSGRSN